MADYISKCISLNENGRIPIHISLNFIPKSPVDNKSTLVQVIAWRRTGDKPLPEPIMTKSIDAYMRALGGDELIVLYASVDTEISIRSIMYKLQSWYCEGKMLKFASFIKQFIYINTLTYS